jgi:hypothetical protein
MDIFVMIFPPHDESNVSPVKHTGGEREGNSIPFEFIVPAGRRNGVSRLR